MSQSDLNSSIHFDKSNNPEDDNYENDDLISFQLDSNTINFCYSQLTKYSKLIREEYLFSDVINRFPQELRQFQEESKLSLSSIIFFYQILQQNFNISENANFKYDQCADILNISKRFEIRKLTKRMTDYIKTRITDVDFIIEMLQYENQKRNNNSEIEINSEIEEVLVSKIDECFLKDKFAELPISTIYRIVEKCPNKKAISDKLYDFIKKSIGKFYILFQFVETANLSEDRLREACDVFSQMDDKSQRYLSCMRISLSLLRETLNQKKTLEVINESQETRVKSLEEQIKEMRKQFQQLDQQQRSKNDDLESTIKQLKDQLKESKEATDQLSERLKISEEEKERISSKLSDAEKSNKELQEKLEEELSLCKGEIIPSVRSGLIVSARIKLSSIKGILDSSRSKYIVSTSSEKQIGEGGYARGEAITSLEMSTTEFICGAGTYFVRCIVFSSDGRSQELVSNGVTTSGSSVLLPYAGKEANFSLLAGKYKLEVWGGQGGDSTGTRATDCDSPNNGQGGFGGYSRGILNLNETEKIHVFVGGAGEAGSARDGAATSGAFPDGGGTRTGHRDSATCVPGTGGGSTSIRLKSSTDFHRVIVAGGGGGASGNSYKTDSGGFGGGTAGGNCSYCGEILDQGSGTQTGSTRGRGCLGDGDAGEFGRGATSKYMQGRDSGGGGGGGWYGGGSGGIGGYWDCSSGGGGSGWVFTEASFREWESGDRQNSSKFLLGSAYHLTDPLTLGGDQELPRPDGNGTERGYRGNGYARITIE